MPIVTYCYKRLKDLRVPIITLAIQYGEKWYPVEAYVDTGASSVISRSVSTKGLLLSLSCSTGRQNRELRWWQRR